ELLEAPGFSQAAHHVQLGIEAELARHRSQQLDAAVEVVPVTAQLLADSADFRLFVGGDIATEALDGDIEAALEQNLAMLVHGLAASQALAPERVGHHHP